MPNIDCHCLCCRFVDSLFSWPWSAIGEEKNGYLTIALLGKFYFLFRFS